MSYEYKHAQARALRADEDVFLAAGGKIDHIKMGVSANTPHETVGKRDRQVVRQQQQRAYQARVSSGIVTNEVITRAFALAQSDK